MILGAVSVNRALHSISGERKGVRLPILLVKIYIPRGEKRVYVLIDTGLDENLLSRKLYGEMNLQDVPLQVLLVSANGRRSLVSTIDTKFRIGPIDNKATRIDIYLLPYY